MTATIHKCFSIEEYHHLIELGFFREGDRIELIRGDIIQMAAKGMLHSVCCTKLNQALTPLLAQKALLRCQDPIVLPSASEPEPDFAIVRNREDEYILGHPTPEDIILVIEIADSSLDYDRQVKLPLYAEANIEHYWLFNLADKQLETYSQPYQKLTGSFDYRQRLIFLPDKIVELPHFNNLILDLSSIFPDQDSQD
jgi:Uma2 family endonuclease